MQKSTVSEVTDFDIFPTYEIAIFQKCNILQFPSGQQKVITLSKCNFRRYDSHRKMRIVGNMKRETQNNLNECWDDVTLL